MKILIAGYGYVGKAVHRLFPSAEVYDPYILGYKMLMDTKYDFCMICVPTPMLDDGTCDISAVVDVLGKVKSDVFVIRSTIPPRAVDTLSGVLGLNIVFQPEYVASSSPYPAPMDDIKLHPFIILGGDSTSVKKVRRLYEHVYPPTVEFMETTARTAGVIKYAENCYIANKVTFCNEIYNICQAFGVDYDEVKKGVFELDPRMNTWWTNVYEDSRGWGGHCLPKDVSAIIKASEDLGYVPQFLIDIVVNNASHRGVVK